MAMFGVVFHSQTRDGAMLTPSFHISGAAAVAETIAETQRLHAQPDSNARLIGFTVTHEYKKDDGSLAFDDVTDVFQ